MKDSTGTRKTAYRITTSLLILLVAGLSSAELFDATQGTQNWVGKFTLTWGAALAGLVLIGFVIVVYALLQIWGVVWSSRVNTTLIEFRNKIGRIGWVFIPLLALLPAKIFLYTPLGEKLTGISFRLAIFLIITMVVSALATRENDRLVSMEGALIGLVVVGSLFAVAKVFITVVDHPLSLTWSEGNRMWDYSILFAKDLYNYPPDQPIEAYIDKARQTLWGLPFLLPGIKIQAVRFWSALVFTLPYVLLGWMLFRSKTHEVKSWFWLGIWSFLFLFQGPIYTPLILSAILVVGARKKPLWLALPLIYLSGYYAQSSRITWMVAPAMWAVITAMMDANDTTEEETPQKKWGRMIVYGAAGFLGGFGIIRGWRRLYNYITRAIVSNAGGAAPSAEVTFINPGDSVEAVSAVGQTSALSNQPLIWERLLPNPTYGLGILLGLTLAAGPLIIILIYQARRNGWQLTIYQKLIILGINGVLMGLGIFISTKIGGGGDLHNLDMFFIGLLFTAVLAWRSGGDNLFLDLGNQPSGTKLTLLLVAVIPAFMPWIDARPLELPPEDKTEWTLALLESETKRVLSEGGEVLFMDQRQLLTFGTLGDVPLVPDYEKKLVMDKAMSGDDEYFEKFYEDISSQRFSLIVTDPQRIRFSDDDEGWGAENDTWVQWVTTPLLCYYEPAFTIKKTGVWLLHPVEDISGCSTP